MDLEEQMQQESGAWQERFLEELRVGGVVQDACAAAGVCKQTAYNARVRALARRQDGLGKVGHDFAVQWDDALTQAMQRIASVQKAAGTRAKPLPALPRGVWKRKFIEELRRSGLVRDACLAANIAPQTAYQARKKSMAHRANGKTNAHDGFALEWDAAIQEAVEREAKPFVIRHPATTREILPQSEPEKKQRPRLPQASWHDKFLAELRVRGIVKDAARAAHINLSTAYAARQATQTRKLDATETQDGSPVPSFASRWDEAVEEAVERMEEEAWRRGYDGYNDPVYYRGRLVGDIKRYSDKLLILLLKAHRPEKYRDNPPKTVQLAPETRAVLTKYYEAIGERRKEAADNNQ